MQNRPTEQQRREWQRREWGGWRHDMRHSLEQYRLALAHGLINTAQARADEVVYLRQRMRWAAVPRLNSTARSKKSREKQFASSEWLALAARWREEAYAIAEAIQTQRRRGAKGTFTNLTTRMVALRDCADDIEAIGRAAKANVKADRP